MFCEDHHDQHALTSESYTEMCTVNFLEHVADMLVGERQTVAALASLCGTQYEPTPPVI